MKHAKTYQQVTKCFLRPELRRCPTCDTSLRQHTTISQRTIVTLKGVMRLTHCGYRCPNPHCPTPKRIYRSAAADELALPSFTFGLDVIILVGYLRLKDHRTLDEVHEELLHRFASWDVTISRREILYLFEVYCTLLQAAEPPEQDTQWLALVQENGGIILSLDGIQPDKGNETIYLARDVLTGRVLAAENVSSSEKAIMKQILAPVCALNVPVLGIISDAQESILLAVQELWPQVPHQICQFHVLREAARPLSEQDRKLKVGVRKAFQPKLRQARLQLEQQRQTATGAEAQQVAVLSDYVVGIQAALNGEGIQPFGTPGAGAYEALGAIENSLRELGKKGGQ